MKNTIKNIYAREILDSTGHPTIEVELETEKGDVTRATVPSGISNNKKEELTIKDNDVKRYNGNGMLKAIHNINTTLKKELCGMNVLNQKIIDEYMIYLDGTKSKSSFGINSILGISMAVARAGAKSLNMPLYQYIGGISGSSIPTPMMSIINGGCLADNNIDIESFMIVPRKAENFAEKMRMCVEVYNALKNILQEDGIRTGIGDEGGFCPNIRDDWECLDYLMRAISKAGYEENFAIAIDVSASQMYENGKYVFKKRNEEYLADKLIEIYKNLVDRYPIIAIEDGLAKDDIEGWTKLTNELGNKIHLVGNNFFETNMNKLLDGIKLRVANSLTVDLNQVGTISEAIEVIKMAKANGYMPIMAHHYGETEDSFIADFAVALNLKYIKCGAPVRGENVAKYNQLLRIEENISSISERENSHI